MARGSKTHRWRDFSGGVQRFLAPTIFGANETRYTKNSCLLFPGRLRPGYTMAGVTFLPESGAIAVKGLFTFRGSDGGEELVRVADSKLQYMTLGIDGNVWTDIATLFSSTPSTAKAEGVSGFVDSEQRVYVVSGHDDVLSHWDGTTTGTVANTYAYHIEYYKGRLYLGNFYDGTTTSPQRVQFSAVNADTFDTAKDYFDDLGEPVTGLKVFGNNLYVYGRTSLGIWDTYSFQLLPGLFGTDSARSIVTTESGIFWYNKTGIYMHNGAGLPQRISDPIRDVLEDASDPDAVAAGRDREGRVMFSFQDLSGSFAEDTTGVVAVYEPRANNWTITSQDAFIGSSGGSETIKPLMFAYVKKPSDTSVIPSVVGSTYFAHTRSNTGVLRVGNLDGSSGNADFEWRAYFDAGDISARKDFKRIGFTLDGGGSGYLTVKYKLDDEASWQQIAGTDNNVAIPSVITDTTLDLPQQLEGHSIEFQVTVSGAVVFDILEINLEYDAVKRP